MIESLQTSLDFSTPQFSYPLLVLLNIAWKTQIVV